MSELDYLRSYVLHLEHRIRSQRREISKLHGLRAGDAVARATLHEIHRLTRGAIPNISKIDQLGVLAEDTASRFAPDPFAVEMTI